MQREAFSVAIVRSANGRTEIVSRPGHLEPYAFARAIAGATGGMITAVRHEHVTLEGGQRRTIAVFPMES